MREDHILDGDFIVVEQTQVANPGEIVVALVGEDEATVKRFYREPGGKIRLQPANSSDGADHGGRNGCENSRTRSRGSPQVLRASA